MNYDVEDFAYIAAEGTQAEDVWQFRNEPERKEFLRWSFDSEFERRFADRHLVAVRQLPSGEIDRRACAVGGAAGVSLDMLDAAAVCAHLFDGAPMRLDHPPLLLPCVPVPALPVDVFDYEGFAERARGAACVACNR